MTKIKWVILGYLGYLRVMKNRCYNAKKKPYNPFNPLTRKISFIYRKFFLYTCLDFTQTENFFIYVCKKMGYLGYLGYLA